MFLVKEGGSYPKAIKSLDKYFENHTFNGSIRISKNPPDKDFVEEKLNKPEEFPDIRSIVDDVMNNYTRVMIHPGCPMVVRGIMDCDPPEPPEYDLPDEDDFRFEVCDSWANEFLEGTGLTIDSMKLSDEDRYAILEAAEEAYTEEFGHWPSNQEIIEDYALDYYPEPERDY